MSKLHLLTRSASTFVRLLQFMISALILGIFSYFLATLSRRNGAVIPQWQKAVEGMSGAAIIYTAFAVILTCFLGGVTFFAFIAVLLDILFCGCMVAIAILAKAGARSCGRINDSPIGPGNRTSCMLQRVAFIVAIIGAFLFALSAILQVALSRSHKREKRYGPSPANDYTSGSGSSKRRPWQRKNKVAKDSELGTFGAGAPAHEDHHHNNTNETAVFDANGTDHAYGGSNTKYNDAPTLPSQHHGFTRDVHHNPGVGAGANSNTMTSTTTAPTYGTVSDTGYATPQHQQHDSMVSSVGNEPFHNQQQSQGLQSGITGAPGDYGHNASTELPATGRSTNANTGGFAEMEAGQPGSAQNPNIIHEADPYAHVHHGGLPHQSTMDREAR